MPNMKTGALSLTEEEHEGRPTSSWIELEPRIMDLSGYCVRAERGSYHVDPANCGPRALGGLTFLLSGARFFGADVRAERFWNLLSPLLPEDPFDTESEPAGGTRSFQFYVAQGENRLSDIRSLARRFIELVRSLPQVKQVLLQTRRGIPRIWVVIDSEAFDFSKRDDIYSAQLAARDAYPDVEVDFRVKNIAEYHDMPPDQFLPPDAEVIWPRR